MNRQLLVICILLSMLALRAEPIHVALLGSPAQLVDLLQAELSELKELALLERREIDKIMQERKLAELSWENLSKEFPHTDVLVVLSENNKGKVGRVLAFNAKNGARLMDMNWHGNPYEHVIELSGEVQSAAAKQTMDGVRYLAWAETRFVNVMDSLKGKCNAWRQLFEQNLLRQETIQLLERERLDIVLSERRLTEQAYALNSSGHLIGLEFEGRGRKDEINCKLICMDVSGEKQFAVEIKDILTALEKTAAEFAVEFEQTLSKLVIDKAAEGKDRKVEAAKYFKMYNTFDAHHYIRKNPWALAAAVALDPDNPVYRYQELADFDVRPDPVNAQWLKKANLAWEMALKFRRDFPDINIDYLPHSQIYSMALAASELQVRIEEHKRCGHLAIVNEMERTLVALDGFYRKYRPYVMEDFLRQGERVAFDDGKVRPNGFRKLGSGYIIYHTNLYYEYGRYGFYVDEKEQANDYLHSLNSWLEPEKAKRLIGNDRVELYPLPWSAMTSSACIDDFLKFAKENKLAEKLAAYEVDVKKNSIFVEAFMLDFLIKGIDAEKQEDVKTVFGQLLATARKKDPMKFSKTEKDKDFKHYYQKTIVFMVMTAVARKHGLSEDFVWECLKKEISESSGNEEPVDIDKAIREVISSRGNDESMKKLMPYVPQFKRDVMKYLMDEGGYYDLLVLMGQAVWNSSRMNSIWMNPYPNSSMQPPSGGMGPILTPPKDEFFKAVNEDAKLKYGPYSEFLKTKDDIILHQACRDGDNLLLLLEKIENERIMTNGRIMDRPDQQKPKQFTLISLHPDLTCDIIKNPIILSKPKNASKHGGQSLYWGAGLGVNQVCQMACNPSFIVIGNRSVLWIFDRKTNAITATIQIPVTTNMEIAMTNERLYILSPTRLMSMNFQGEDRQMIFDTERLDAQSEMDKKGQASCLHILPDDHLMFMGNWKIWTCNSDGSELKSCIRLPYGRYYALYDDGEGPLLSAAGDYNKNKNCIIYRVDIDKWKLDMIAQTPDRIMFKPNGGTVTVTRRNVEIPYSGYKTVDQFIVKNGWLFQGHFFPLCVKTSAPEKSPFLWLPATYKLLSIGDYVMFMRNNCWFMMDIKEMGNEK